MINFSYKPTPLMEQIDRRLNRSHHLQAFAVADFGDGPILTYRGRHSRVSKLSILLFHGEQRIELSQFSKPPYLIALVQEKPDQPILTALYRSDPYPVLEQSTECRLTGQVFAYGQSQDGSMRTAAHAVYFPEHTAVFAVTDRLNSLLLESHPELCAHLCACAEIIDRLLHQQKEWG